MKRFLPIIMIVLLFLGGAGLVLYPVVSSWYMDRHQGQVVADYDEEAAKLSQEQIEEELEKARKYNESLLDMWSSQTRSMRRRWRNRIQSMRIC